MQHLVTERERGQIQRKLLFFTCFMFYESLIPALTGYSIYQRPPIELKLHNMIGQYPAI